MYFACYFAFGFGCCDDFIPSFQTPVAPCFVWPCWGFKCSLLCIFQYMLAMNFLVLIVDFLKYFLSCLKLFQSARMSWIGSSFRFHTFMEFNSYLIQLFLLRS